MMSPSQHCGTGFPFFPSPPLSQPYQDQFSPYHSFRNSCIGPGSTTSSSFLGPSSSPSSDSSSSPDTLRGYEPRAGPAGPTGWPPGSPYSGTYVPNTVAPSAAAAVTAGGGPAAVSSHLDNRLNRLNLESAAAARPAAAGYGRGSAPPGAAPHPTTSHTQQSHRPGFSGASAGLSRIPESLLGGDPGGGAGGGGGAGVPLPGGPPPVGMGGGWQTQHIPPMQESYTGQMHFSNTGHYDPSTSLNDLNLPVSLNHLGLDEQQLVDTQTRELNKTLKAKGLSKDIIKEIKARRRTMKNRDYAKQGGPVTCTKFFLIAKQSAAIVKLHLLRIFRVPPLARLCQIAELYEG